MHAHTKEQLSQLKPQQALQYLKEGNNRFVNNEKADRDLLQQVSETKGGQHPFATVLSCMDSRTSAELIFDQGLGDIFSIRVAGNVLNEDVLGSMEYATKVVGTKIILVLGHTRCGAVVGACEGVQLGNLTQLLQKIQPAIDSETTTKDNRNGKNPDFVKNVTDINVRQTMDQILQQSPTIAELVKEGQVQIIGGVYDVDSGKVTFFED